MKDITKMLYMILGGLFLMLGFFTGFWFCVSIEMGIWAACIDTVVVIFTYVLEKNNEED